MESEGARGFLRCEHLRMATAFVRRSYSIKQIYRILLEGIAIAALVIRFGLLILQLYVLAITTDQVVKYLTITDAILHGIYLSICFGMLMIDLCLYKHCATLKRWNTPTFHGVMTLYALMCFVFGAVCAATIYSWDQNSVTVCRLALELGTSIAFFITRLGRLLVILVLYVVDNCKGRYKDIVAKFRIRTYGAFNKCMFCQQMGAQQCGRRAFHRECMQHFMTNNNMATIITVFGSNGNTALDRIATTICSGTIRFRGLPSFPIVFLGFVYKKKMYIVDAQAQGRVICMPSDQQIFSATTNNFYNLYSSYNDLVGMCVYYTKPDGPPIIATPWTKYARVWPFFLPDCICLDRWLVSYPSKRGSSSIMAIDMLDEEAGPIQLPLHMARLYCCPRANIGTVYVPQCGHVDLWGFLRQPLKTNAHTLS